MVSSFALAFLSLTLFALIVESRKNPTDEVKPLITNFDSKDGNNVFYHGQDDAKPLMKDFNSKYGNYYYHGQDDAKPLKKDFNSKYGNYYYHGQDDAKPKDSHDAKQQENPLIKDFDSSHENYPQYQLGQGDAKPEEKLLKKDI